MPKELADGLNSTRQMLDDLDALMEKMLALPMDEAEPASPPRRPALAATLTMLPAFETEVTPKSPSPIQAPHADFSPPVQVKQEDEPPIPPPLTIRRLDAVVSSEPLPVVPKRTFLLWRPLLWINQAFDQCTRLLGPLGQVLRSTPGRLLLGGAGLVLLGVAAAWLTRDLLTWTP